MLFKTENFYPSFWVVIAELQISKRNHNIFIITSSLGMVFSGSVDSDENKVAIDSCITTTKVGETTVVDVCGITNVCGGEVGGGGIVVEVTITEVLMFGILSFSLKDSVCETPGVVTFIFSGI